MMLAFGKRFAAAAVVVVTCSAVGYAAAVTGVDRGAMDAKIAPGDDFWGYANGAWVASHPIPSDRSSYGSAAILVEQANKRTVDLIQAAAAGAKPGSDAQKVGDYYASFMDEAGIEAKGVAPLKPVLAKIAAVNDRAALTRLLGEGLRADVDVLNNTDLYTDNVLGLWVSPSFDDPTRYSAFLIQGGLGMPDRDYYLSDKEAMKKARAQYVTHIAAMLKLAGIEGGEAKAQRIMALETKIATSHASRSESDDVQKGNNPWARADFAKNAPGLDWGLYFGAAGLEKQKRFIVWQPSAVKGISALVASEPVEDWKDYLALRAADHYGDYLPKAFSTERFAFYGTVLQGTPEQRARWKRAVDATNGALGEVVGKLYVAKYFPAEAKAQLKTMVANLIAAYGKRIEALDWMAASTKAEAKRKLSTLKVGIAYPDKWRDYSALAVVRGDALGNVQRAEAFEYRYRLARLGKPVDRDEWVMTPQTVNAVNLPILNSLNFPAAILQAPFYDPAASAAMNYGGIGATIGHEISHSFDDTGAQFDATGRLRNWWTEADLKKFQGAGEALALQFDGYRPFPDLAVNGHQTLGENIADLAGLAASYDAYRAANGGKAGADVDGFTGDQQFFLSYAQSWCTYLRPEALRQRIVNDGHAPAQYRALTVRNIDAWYAAFPVKEGDKLFLAPDKRVRVW
ncbi:MAG: M13 family metallopeptidase [Alphaproteobacteria bacterium]|nr:M13 family metallopeptidase [Alphaproteobacteria bacterium]